jgi:hypothetical protein
VTSLANVTSKYVYAQFTSSLPLPKVESRQPDLPSVLPGPGWRALPSLPPPPM